MIIGGVAVSYFYDPENIRRIVRALAPLHPRLRVPGTSEGVPFPFDERTVHNGGKFTLKTDAGDLDILAHVGGFYDYAELKSFALQIGNWPLTFSLPA